MTRTIRPRIATTFIACTLAASSVFGVAQAANNQPIAEPSAAAKHLVISALQVGACTGTPCVDQPAGEFVELYNASDENLAVSHWKLRYLPASGNIGSQKELADLNGSIAAHSYILVSHVSLGLADADFTFGTADDTGKLAESAGHVEVLDGTGVMVDRIGWGSSAKLALGPYATKPNPGQQLQRNNNDAGLLIDTQHNAQDFKIVSAYSPQGGGYTPATPEVPEEDPTDDQDDPGNPDGPPPIKTPGKNTACTDITISEILPNPAGSDSGLEYIELHNPTATAISLAGCSLQLGGSSKVYALAATTIAADGYVMLSDSITGITLPNSSGGTVLLFNSSTDLQTITYPPNLEDDASWVFADGLWTSSYTPTPGRPNIITTVKPCSEGQARNAETNRCVAVADNSATTATAAQAACPTGQERNPDTNRCRSTGAASAASNSPTPCKAGQERNPETNRCRTATSASSSTLQSCPTGQERNPDTNRCRKVAAAGSATGSSSGPGLSDVKDIATNTKPAASKPYGLIIIAALGAVLAYGIYEWRQELRIGIAKLWQKVSQKAQPTKPITSITSLR